MSKHRISIAEQHREALWRTLIAFGDVCQYARKQGYGETFTTLLQPLAERLVGQIADANEAVKAER